jgi:hypothetical protein
MEYSRTKRVRSMIARDESNIQLALRTRRVRVRVFNATFNNISAISWRLVLLVEETGVPEESHRPVVSH